MLRKRLRRVVVGFCANLELSCSATLRQPTAESSLVAMGCEQLLEAAISGSQTMSRFAESLWTARREESSSSAVSLSTVTTPVRDVSDMSDLAAGWQVATLEVIAGVEAEAAAAAAPLSPVVLAAPSPYEGAEAIAADRLEGPAAVALRAARVATAYVLLMGPACALYLCVHRGPAPVPLPVDREPLGGYLRRARAGGAASAVRATLAFSMVDCDPSEMWKFCGITTAMLREMYMRMWRDRATLASITNPEAISVASACVSPGLRCVLPLIHMHAWHRFREAVTSPGAEGGDELTRYLPMATAERPSPTAALVSEIKVSA